jgi:hypothetical protein
MLARAYGVVASKIQTKRGRRMKEDMLGRNSGKAKIQYPNPTHPVYPVKNQPVETTMTRTQLTGMNRMDRKVSVGIPLLLILSIPVQPGSKT